MKRLAIVTLAVVALLLITYGAFNLRRGMSEWVVTPADDPASRATVGREFVLDERGGVDRSVGAIQLALGSTLVVALVLLSRRDRLARTTGALHTLTALHVGVAILSAPSLAEHFSRAFGAALGPPGV